MSKLRIIATWNHSDGVSGTSVFSDGTKAYWSEGRSEHIQLLRANGEDVYTSAYKGEEHYSDPYVKLLNGDDYGTCREMTDVEELEHSMARRGAL